MLAVGPEDLGEELESIIYCPHCSKAHPVEYGEKILDDGTKIPTKTLAFYRCGDKTYLAGIDGRKLK